MKRKEKPMTKAPTTHWELFCSTFQEPSQVGITSSGQKRKLGGSERGGGVQGHTATTGELGCRPGMSGSISRALQL